MCRATMGCIQSGTEKNNEPRRDNRDMHSGSRPARSQEKPINKPTQSSPSQSTPRAIPSSVKSHPANADEDRLGKSIERRQREHAVMAMIVAQAGETFIDVRQSALDLEPEDATDLTAQQFSAEIRQTAISESAITIHALPKPAASNADDLFFNLAVPPLPRDKLELVTNVSNAMATASSTMRIQYTGEPVVVRILT